MAKRNIFPLIKTIFSIFISLFFIIVVICFISDDPGYALKNLLLGPISSLRRFGNVIEATIPLIFTGLAICIMFQANQFNLGSDGLFFIGGVVAAIVAIYIDLPIFFHPLAALLLAALIGGIINAIPAILKIKWNATELVSTIMMNYILVFFGVYILNYVIRDPFAGDTASHKFALSAKLPVIISRSRIHLGVIIPIILVIAGYYFLYKTKWGYELRMTGLNETFARYSGINTKRVILYSQIIGGAIVAAGGATEILGMYNRFQWRESTGYGFDGVMIATLARKNPKYVPLAALFLAYLRTGAAIMGRMTNVSKEIIDVLQAVVIVLIAAKSFLSNLENKNKIQKAKLSIEDNLLKEA